MIYIPPRNHFAHGAAKDTYTGELKFLPLKDWVNLHSESGMGAGLRAELADLNRPEQT